jgi:ArsR family transcriptional regulator, arsenate/arsenite/antimonite-responsive transcriptional repressor
MRTLISVFKALSDETRLKMLGLLLERGELCVCDFVEVLEISQSKASRHLRHLVNARLLDDRRKRTWVYFRTVDEPGPVQARILEILPSVLDGRLPPELLLQLELWLTKKACSDIAWRDLSEEAKSTQGGM